MQLQKRLLQLKKYIQDKEYNKAWDEIESILAQAKNESCEWEICQELINCLSELHQCQANTEKRNILFYDIRTYLLGQFKPEKQSELLAKISEHYQEDEQALWYLAEALEYNPNDVSLLKRLSSIENIHYLKHFTPYARLLKEVAELKKTLPKSIQVFLNEKNKLHQERCNLMHQLKKLMQYQTDVKEFKFAYEQYKDFLKNYCEALQTRFMLYFERQKEGNEELQMDKYPPESLDALLNELRDALHFILGWENKIHLSEQILGRYLRKEIWDKYYSHLPKVLPKEQLSIFEQIKDMASDLESISFPHLLYSDSWPQQRAHHHKIKNIFFTSQKDELENHEDFQISLLQLLNHSMQSISSLCINPPCHWCLCTMGSVARGDGSSYSDVDITLLIEKEEFIEHPFFKALLNNFQSFIIALGGTWQWDPEKGFQSLGFQIDQGDLTTSKNRVIHTIQTSKQLADKTLQALQDRNNRQLQDFILAFSLLIVKPIYATDLKLFQDYQKELHNGFSQINLAEVGWYILQNVKQSITQIKQAKFLKEYIKPLHLIFLGLYCLEQNPDFTSFKWKNIYQILPRYLNKTFVGQWCQCLKKLYSIRRKFQERYLISEVAVEKLLEEDQTFLQTLQESFIIFAEGLPTKVSQLQIRPYCPYQAYVAKKYAKMEEKEILRLLQIALKNQEVIELPIELINQLWQAQGKIVVDNQFADLSNLNFLIQLGIHPDTVISKKSLIEHAFDQQNAKAMITLLTQGAGQNPHFLFEHWIDFLIRKESTEFEKILPKWAENNSAVSWYVTKKILFESLPQRERTKEELARFIEGIDIKQRLLKKEVFNQLYETKQGYFTTYTAEKKDNQYGRRSVAKIKIDERTFFFKFFPEAVPMEDAVQQLAHAYFPGTVPHTDLIRYDNANETIPILISEGIVGYNLQDVFNALSNESEARAAALKNTVTPKIAKECLENIDHYSFSQHLLLTLLTNDEDGKPDNKYFVPFKHGTQTLYRIVSIDNDHSFLEPISTDAKGHRSLQLKSILLCLDNMKRPLHPQVLENFLKLNPVDCIESWLKKLAQRQLQYLKLFDGPNAKEINGIREELFKKDVILQVIFPKRRIPQLWNKWQKAKQLLTQNSNLIGLELLRHIMPSVAHFYFRAFNQTTAIARFNYLAQKSYTSTLLGKTIVGYSTISKSTQLLMLQGVKKETLIQKSNGLGPKEAFEEIQLAKQEHTQLELILKQVEQGIFEYKENEELKGFKYLYIDDNKAEVINRLDWNKLKPEHAQVLLNILVNTGLNTSRFILKNCTQLDDIQLELILQKMPDLKELTLENSLVTDKLWNFLPIHCAAIQSLTVKQLPNLISTIQGVFGGIAPELADLTELKIEDLFKLSSLRLNTPKLKQFSLKNLPVLKIVETNSLMLEQFDISETNQLNLEGLANSFDSFSSFKRGRVPKHWQNNQSWFIYTKYPFLLSKTIFKWIPQFDLLLIDLLKNFPVEIINSETWNWLKQIVEIKSKQLYLIEQAVPNLLIALKDGAELVIRGTAATILGTALNDRRGQYVRLSAAEALIRIGEKATTEASTQMLLTMCEDRDQYISSTAAQILSTSGEERVTESIQVTGFRMNSKKFGSNAPRMLDQLSDKTSIDSLLQTLLTDLQSRYKYSEAASALGNLGEKAATETVIQALSSKLRESYNFQGIYLNTDSGRSRISSVRLETTAALGNIGHSLNKKYQALFSALSQISKQQENSLNHKPLSPTQLPSLIVSEHLTEDQLIEVLKKAVVTCYDLTTIQICGLKSQQQIAFPLIQELIMQNKTTLISLDLGKNKFTDVLMKQLLIETLPQCNKLIDLKLHENQLTNLIMKETALLFNECPIKNLILDNNYIDEEGILLFIKELPYKTKLNSLSLNGNPTTVTGLSHLMKISASLNNALLYLDNTGLDDDAYEVLNQLLPKLRGISLKQNQLQTLTPLLKILSNCKNLEQCNLQENLFSKDELITLIEEIQKLKLNSILIENLQQQVDGYLEPPYGCFSPM